MTFLPPNSSLLAPDGSFRMDYLACTDLEFPKQENFLLVHVYKGGEVVLKAATLTELFALCDAKLDKAWRKRGASPVEALQAAGFLVEQFLNMPSFSAARSAYAVEKTRRETEFKRELFRREGLLNNPKAEACYEKAYDMAHLQGLEQVASTFVDLAELIS